MTAQTSLYGLFAWCLGTLTLLMVGLGYFAKPEQAGRRALSRYALNLDAKLGFLRSTVTGQRVIVAQFGLGAAVVALALVRFSAVPLLLLLLIASAPRAYLERRVATRITAIEAQIEPWLVAISNALKASPSLGEAIASTASLMTAPMSEEVDLMVKEYELGTALDRALIQMTERISSRTLTGAVLALQIARNSGGNLPEMLENAAVALRELARLEGVVRTKTAEGKAQSFVIGVIPLPMVVLIHMGDSHFFDPLIYTFTGHLIIGGSAVLWLLAIVLASKILAVDI